MHGATVKFIGHVFKSKMLRRN